MADEHKQHDTEESSQVSEESFPITKEQKMLATFSVKKLPVAAQLSVALGILALALGTTQLPNLVRGMLGNDTQQASASDSAQKETEPAGDPFADITLEAKSAFVWDMKEQRALYNDNADEQLPLASVTKLMTALVAYELLGKDTNVHVTNDAIRQDGDSGLLSDELFSSGNLSDFTLIASSNDGAYALATAGQQVLARAGKVQSFIDVMNMRANEIGLTRTHFKNPTGLDLSKTEGGAYGSARDMAFLMEYLLSTYPGVLESTRTDTAFIDNANGQYHEAANTNAIAGKIPGMLASKTGYTNLAGGNLVVAFDAGLNHPIIIAVLGSSSLGRFTDTLKLVEAATTEVEE